ncbi:hypothetical protein J6590_033812 [Homalodisca vitripennis]|nr:hypothetical protein J6590_033812 [Homalodisca vitripennis]
MGKYKPPWDPVDGRGTRVGRAARCGTGGRGHLKWVLLTDLFCRCYLRSTPLQIRPSRRHLSSNVCVVPLLKGCLSHLANKFSPEFSNVDIYKVLYVDVLATVLNRDSCVYRRESNKASHPDECWRPQAQRPARCCPCDATSCYTGTLAPPSSVTKPGLVESVVAELSVCLTRWVVGASFSVLDKYGYGVRVGVTRSRLQVYCRCEV